MATISPPVADVPVYFQVWDVDDPFDQNNPGLANVALIDNDTIGGDNRPQGQTDPAVGYYPAVITDENGEARVTLTVSMQPGNNYRAAASVIGDVFGGSEPQVDQTDADAKQYDHGGSWSGYEVPAVWSPMLTVWRKLTLEVDSMDQESQDFNVRFGLPFGVGFEHDQCEVGSVSVDDPAPGFTTVYCTDNDGHSVGFAGTDFFEGGALVRRDTGEEFLIVRSHVEGSNVVIVWGNPGADIIGIMCTLRDDDPYFPAGPRQLPRISVLDANIVDAYRDAYIEVVEATPGSVNLVNIIDWQSNLGLPDLIADYTTLQGVSYQWDVGGSDGFWARHVVVCYQPGVSVDADGDDHENCAISENCLAVDAPYPLLPLSPLPAMDKLFGRTIRNESIFDSALSTVYIESIRDNTTDQFSAKFWQYVAHEVGHRTLDQTESEADQGIEHAEGGLMSEGDNLQDHPAYQRFTSPTLLRFRGVRRW